ncbi:MAG: hypothetical protein P8Y66_04400 [Nitrospirota bacterium]|jgi:hypothetical protein
MKKTLIALAAVIAILGGGAAAYAHGNGSPGWGGGPGWWGGNSAYSSEQAQKFFQETADLRRDLAGKMFDYREALRTGDQEKADALTKEITDLRTKIQKKGGPGVFGPRTFGPGYGPGMMYGYGPGYGPGMMYRGGPGWGCPGPGGWR